jgi:hypothetical protein
MKAGYNCAPLHGGIDQFDRDSTIIDFKAGKLKLMVSFLHLGSPQCALIVLNQAHSQDSLTGGGAMTISEHLRRP